MRTGEHRYMKRASNGNPEVIETLLEAGADVRAQAEGFSWSGTPLHSARAG